MENTYSLDDAILGQERWLSFTKREELTSPDEYRRGWQTKHDAALGCLLLMRLVRSRYQDEQTAVAEIYRILLSQYEHLIDIETNGYDTEFMDRLSGPANGIGKMIEVAAEHGWDIQAEIGYPTNMKGGKVLDI